MFASTLIIKSQILNKLSSKLEKPSKFLFGCSSNFLYIFLCSLASGYPSGAKLSCDLYRENRISKNECKRIINATSMSGPLFISGVLCSQILGSSNLFIYIYIPHILSAFITGILLRNSFSKINVQTAQINTPIQTGDLAQNIADAFSSCFKTLLIVFGYMLVFAILLNTIFHDIPPSLPKSIFMGTLELSNGIISLKNISADIFTKIITAEMFVTFGGISVIMQTLSIMSANKIKNAYFITAKLLQTAIACLLCIIFLSIFDVSDILKILPV